MYKDICWANRRLWCTHCYKDYSKWSSPLENYKCGKRKSPLLVPEHFSPCIYWYFTFLHAGNIFRSLEQDLLRTVTGKFRKSFKLKMLGKTAGDSPHGEWKSRTYTFSAKSVKKCNSHCYLYSSANSVTKCSGSLFYSLLIIFYSL